MAAEMCGSRLLAPYFGDSLIIWASLVGLVLTYLTIGYALGGRWADRSPRRVTLYQITFWASINLGLVPLLARPILLLAARGFARYSVPLIVGPLFSVLLLFAIPIILLGCVAPFAVRLQLRQVRRAGRTTGNLYAISNVGSILGTFAPVLLIPNIGTRNTILLFTTILALISLWGLFGILKSRAWWYIIPFIFILVINGISRMGAAQPIKPTTGLIHETESAYNFIQVVREDDNVYLLLNEGEGVHSVYHPREILTERVFDLFLLAPYFRRTSPAVDNVCLIGLAAGTISKQYTAFYGDVTIDGVELDPAIIDIGREYFAMNEPNLNAIAADGRYFLQTSDKQYDVVIIDAYRPPYIPFHLTTLEFFTLVREHLTAHGVVAINAWRTTTDYRLVDALAETMRAAFPAVYIVDDFDYDQGLSNCMIVATKQSTQLSDFENNIASLHTPELSTIVSRAAPRVTPVPNSQVVFTDDRAPVEQIVHQIILAYLN